MIFGACAIAQSCRVIEQRANGLEFQRDTHPSQVLLEVFITYEQKYLASGVLISPNYVLTTVRSILGFSFINVHVYANKLRDVFEDEREIYRTETAFLKPDFDGFRYLNDIALIRLPVTLNIAARSYTLAQLPPAGVRLVEGMEGESVGWGLLNYKDDNAAEYKHEQTMRVISDTECRQAFPNRWSDDFTYNGRVCIKRDSGRNCISDSGAPFFITDFVFGLHSFGQTEACDDDLPNGIQEVAYHFSWINEILQT